MPLSAAYAPWQWLEVFGPFAFQPSLAPLYLACFAAGVVVGAQGLERGLIRTDGVLARCWGRLSALVPAAFLLWIIPTALIVGEHRLPGLRLAADLGLVLCAALTCAALLAVFLRFAAAPRPILGSFSEHAYGIYLFHYPFVVWLQLLLLETALPSWSGTRNRPNGLRATATMTLLWLRQPCSAGSLRWLSPSHP